VDLLNDKHKQWGRSKFRKLGGSKPFQVEDVGRHQDRLFYELWRGERGFGACPAALIDDPWTHWKESPYGCTREGTG